MNIPKGTASIRKREENGACNAVRTSKYIVINRYTRINLVKEESHKIGDLRKAVKPYTEQADNFFNTSTQAAKMKFNGTNEI